MTFKDVANIFKHYFKEENVDCHNNYIIVKWDTVTVSNEMDESITLLNLFGRVRVNTDGSAIDNQIQLLKATYSFLEWDKCYVHSHVPRLNYTIPEEWKSCCLGSGPIRHTLNILGCEPTEDRWLLFCMEFDKYVRVESIYGGPYIRMNSLTTGNGRLYDVSNSYSTTYAEDDLIHTAAQKKLVFNFIEYLLNKRILRYSFNSNYDLAGSLYENVIKITDCFYKYLKQNNINKEDFIYLFTEVTARNNTLYTVNNNDNSRETAMRNQNKVLLYFKGNPVKLNITREQNVVSRNIEVISFYLYSYIKWKICTYLNTQYGRN